MGSNSSSDSEETTTKKKTRMLCSSSPQPHHDSGTVEDLPTTSIFKNGEHHICTLKNPGDARSLQFSPNGKWLVTATFKILVHDASSVSLINSHTKSSQQNADDFFPQIAEVDYDANNHICDMRFSSDSKFLAAVSWNNNVVVVDTSTWKVLYTFREHHGDCRDCSWQPNHHFLITIGDCNTTICWDIDKCLQNELSSSPSFPDCGTVLLSGRRVCAVDFNPKDENRVVLGDESATLQMYQFNDGIVDKKGKPSLDSIWSVKKHTARIWCQCFSTDGTLIVTGSYDHSVMVLSAYDGSLLLHIKGSEMGEDAGHPVWAVALDRFNYSLAAGGQNGWIRMIQLEKKHKPQSAAVSDSSSSCVSLVGKPLGTLEAPNVGSDMVFKIDFSPCSKVLAVAQHSGSIQIWRNIGPELLFQNRKIVFAIHILGKKETAFYRAMDVWNIKFLTAKFLA